MDTKKLGYIVKTYTTKIGRRATLRYPAWSDLNKLLAYVNALSKENTFLPMSGERISLEEQQKQLDRQLKNIRTGNGVTIFCFINGRLVGTATVYRNISAKKRSLHVGILGISVAKEFRGEGIGFELTSTILEEAKKHMPDLQMILLHVYAVNEVAIGLYAKLGFIETGRIPKGVLYKGEYIDEVIMCKDI